MQRRLSDDEDMVVMDMDDYGVVVGSSVSNISYILTPSTSCRCMLFETYLHPLRLAVAHALSSTGKATCNYMCLCSKVANNGLALQ